MSRVNQDEIPQNETEKLNPLKKIHFSSHQLRELGVTDRNPSTHLEKKNKKLLTD